MNTSKSSVLDTLRKDILKIAKHAISAVQPERAIFAHCSLTGDVLRVADRDFDLTNFRTIHVVGAGKASVYMARALEQLLGERINGGIVSTKAGYDCELQRATVVLASHPVPDSSSVEAAETALKTCSSLGKSDLVICLISGGASALWALPAEGISLQEKMRAFELLLKCGADIHDMNCVRKHLSQIKGGQLAATAHPATVLTLIISDVVGDQVSSIGSGPTVADPTTYADAISIIRKYELESKLPAATVNWLRDGEAGKNRETPKTDAGIWDGNHVQIVASNQQALKAAEAEGQRLGYDVEIVSNALVGDAREVGKKLALRAREASRSRQRNSRPMLLVAGGETTVTVRGNGKGGRNQELVLAAAMELAGNETVVIASVGTDGIDGNTDAAGAIADGTTVSRGEQLHLSAADFLASNDSYNYFDQVDGLIRTGPTGTNVMDIQILGVRV